MISAPPFIPRGLKLRCLCPTPPLRRTFSRQSCACDVRRISSIGYFYEPDSAALVDPLNDITCSDWSSFYSSDQYHTWHLSYGGTIADPSITGFMWYLFVGEYTTGLIAGCVAGEFACEVRSPPACNSSYVPRMT